MNDLDFLNKLKQDGKIELVKPSEEISKSYLSKSEKCMQVAKLAYGADIYENAISESYYSVYNVVQTLFFKCGIKCENHSGAVILIRDLFKLSKPYVIFSELKKDRIDNQYYVQTKGNEEINKEDCDKKIKVAQKFNTEMRAIIGNLSNQYVLQVREKF